MRSLLALTFAVALCTACGTPGPVGPQGPAGPAGTGTPSINEVTPLKVFLGRKAEVTISGNGTAWTAATTVSFGADITVDKLVVASPTALIASLTIAQTAAVGPRDVTVTEAGASLTWTQIFEVNSPITFEITGGTLAQGSVVFSSVRLLDLTTPFDSTSTGDGFFTPMTYSNLVLDLGPRATVSSLAVKDFGLTCTTFLDLDAPATATSAVVTSGPAGAQIVSTAAGAYTPVARTGTPLPAGTTDVATTTPYASKLFSLAPVAALSVSELTVTSPVVGEGARAFVLAASGHWADLITSASSTGPAMYLRQPGQAASVVFFDSAGTQGAYKLVAADTVPAVTATELAGATTAAMAQSADQLPFLMTGGKLTTAAYSHVVKLTITAADVGKVIHAYTLAGDRQADTVLEILQGPTTSFAGPSSDQVYLDDLITSPITTAGDYYVVVTASTMWVTAHQNYNLFVRLE
jgi:hypothetical protein